MTAQLGVALPFWLDRPDEEALEIALIAERTGIRTVWVGEMASFDAFALATATGMRTERVRLKVGPLAASVRSPVAIALGVSSVATLIGRPVDVALGASSALIVSGWHGRDWTGLAERMRETVSALRALLDGERVHNFKLRRPEPETSITVAAFGSAMIKVAAQTADEVVLNLVGPEHVADVRARIDEAAAEAGRTAPRLAVWVPAALNPGDAAWGQLTGQLAVYLGAPGYGEMFSKLGYEELVERARSGARRAELAAELPLELIEQIGALGTAGEIAGRIDAYGEAGADHVAIVPSTATDPAGERVLTALTREVVA